MYRGTGASLLAQGEQVLVDDVAPPRATKSYPCAKKTGMCITQSSERQVRARAQQACPGVAVVRGVGAVNCSLTSIGVGNWQNYDPCWVKGLPTCAPPSVDEPDTVITNITPPEDEVVDEGDDENNSYIIGGLLALLVAGGVTYAVMKKRKKKGKR